MRTRFLVTCVECGIKERRFSKREDAEVFALEHKNAYIERLYCR